MTRLSAALRWIVGLVFLLAGFGKLAGEPGPKMAPIVFQDLSGGELVTADAAETALPWVELVVGVAFVLAVGRLARHAIAIGVATVFAIASQHLPEGVRCGCFGVFGGVADAAAHRVIAAVLLVLSAAAAVVEFLIRRPVSRCPE